MEVCPSQASDEGGQGERQADTGDRYRQAAVVETAGAWAARAPARPARPTSPMAVTE